jgi:hypothetical protein
MTGAAVLRALDSRSLRNTLDSRAFSGRALSLRLYLPAPMPVLNLMVVGAWDGPCFVIGRYIGRYYPNVSKHRCFEYALTKLGT